MVLVEKDPAGFLTMIETNATNNSVYWILLVSGAGHVTLESSLLVVIHTHNYFPHRVFHFLSTSLREFRFIAHDVPHFIMRLSHTTQVF